MMYDVTSITELQLESVSKSTMAGSRVEKVGTIFSRCTGLIKSKTLAYEERPLWYDVYKAFPPKYEPYYDRPAINKEIPNIFYPEDEIRARFYKTFGSPGTIDMTQKDSKSISQRFVETYMELEKGSSQHGEDIFQATVNKLNSQGIFLEKQRTSN